MLEHASTSPRAAEHPLSSLIKTSAILRIGTGIMLMSRHAWEGIWNAYQFLWKEQPWHWVVTFAEEGVPVPYLAAPFAALLLFVVALAFIVGFVTRLFAAILLSLCCIALLFAQNDYAAFSELCGLYGLISFTLLLFGSGAVSLDQLITLGSRSKPAAPRY
jgi:uncharacterized membrane protein YphA (DoxX/SURF4 family)